MPKIQVTVRDAKFDKRKLVLVLYCEDNKGNNKGIVLDRDLLIPLIPGIKDLGPEDFATVLEDSIPQWIGKKKFIEWQEDNKE